MMMRLLVVLLEPIAPVNDEVAAGPSVAVALLVLHKVETI
jgi:hypothetical protein